MTKKKKKDTAITNIFAAFDANTCVIICVKTHVHASAFAIVDDHPARAFLESVDESIPNQNRTPHFATFFPIFRVFLSLNNSNILSVYK